MTKDRLVELPLCEWCREKRVKRKGKRFCSKSCGSSSRGVRSIFWQRKDGRWFVKTRQGHYTTYARALMEGYLRRHLLPGEVVHHINEDRTDDRIDNLQVLTKADHVRLHRPGCRTLTVEQVRDIRTNSLRTGLLAERHGVAASTIKCVRNRITWGWVQ